MVDATDVHLTPKEVALRLRTTTEALRVMRQRREGPGYIRSGRRKVLYPLTAIEKWEKANYVDA